MKPILDILEDLEQKIRNTKKDIKSSFSERTAKRELKRRHVMRDYMWKAGITMPSKKIARVIFTLAVIINLVISIYLVAGFSFKYGFNPAYLLASLIFVWVLVSAAFLFIVWLGFYLALDLIIYNRKVEIEDVLPDFLQLTSANIRAGMPIDRALWFAVRPRFGVLSKEIEEVAKRTFVGEDLEHGLREFASKYDSLVLKRSIYLLIEGLNAGGEVGGLLDRIATNIQQIKTMKKEMAANVTTYVIFISVAVIFGAPFLYALSNTLINIIQEIGSAIDIPSGGASGMQFSFSSDVIKLSDFRIFAFTTLTITSLSASAIISTIQKGSVKAGLKYIPMFLATTMFLFWVFSAGFSSIFSGLF